MQALRKKQSGIQQCVCNKGESDILHLRYSALCESEEESGTLCCVGEERREWHSVLLEEDILTGEIDTQHHVRKRGENGVQHCMCEQKETSTLITHQGREERRRTAHSTVRPAVVQNVAISNLNVSGGEVGCYVAATTEAAPHTLLYLRKHPCAQNLHLLLGLHGRAQQNRLPLWPRHTAPVQSEGRAERGQGAARARSWRGQSEDRAKACRGHVEGMSRACRGHVEDRAERGHR
jgi:hypothetical protein